MQTILSAGHRHSREAVFWHLLRSLLADHLSCLMPMSGHRTCVWLRISRSQVVCCFAGGRQCQRAQQPCTGCRGGGNGRGPAERLASILRCRRARRGSRVGRRRCRARDPARAGTGRESPRVTEPHWTQVKNHRRRMLDQDNHTKLHHGAMSEASWLLILNWSIDAAKHSQRPLLRVV